MTVMDEQYVKDFAREIMWKYYADNDVDFLVATFAEDIIWQGAGEHQYAEGIEAVSQHFYAGKDELMPCELYDERYTVRKLGVGYCYCEGESWVKNSGEEAYLNEKQRTTFIFREEADGLKTVHIHHSIAYRMLLEEELFPATAYKELQWRLNQKDEQIELLLSQLIGGIQICYIDEQFTTKWISEGLCSMLGFADEEEYNRLAQGSCAGFIDPEDYPVVSQEVINSLMVGDVYNVEYRIVRQDGSRRWVADTGKRLLDSDGEEVLYCLISDINERKERQMEIEKAHREIQRKAAFLSQLYDTVPCGIMQFTTDRDHKILTINNATWQFYRFANEQEYFDAIQSPVELVQLEDRPQVLSAIDTLKLGGDSVTYNRRCIRKDGSEGWISAVMERLINAEGLEVIQAVFTDITQMKQMEQLQTQERLLENQILRTAIYTAYPIILSVNLSKNTCESFSSGEYAIYVEGQAVYDDFIQEAQQRAYPTYRADFLAAFSRDNILEQFAAGEQEIYMELQFRNDDELYHWLSIQLIYVENTVSNDIMAIVLLKMMDKQRAEKAKQEQILRDALASAQAANQAKSDFLSRMSHDIRTPLNAIMGMSAIGQLKAGDEQQVRACLHKIGTSSQYLLSLINDILDMAKIETGKMMVIREKFDFTEMMTEINTIILPQAEQRGLNYEVRHTEPIQHAYVGDALRIKQILMNLLSNALKFTPAGGSIHINIQETKRTNGFAYMKFEIRDTGMGINKEFLEHLFEPFEQESSDGARNNIGSGLGLSIVYNLVQLMGGVITVESEKSKGSTFTVVLPLGLIDDDAEIEKERKFRELLQGQSILVVDDDPAIGEQTAKLFGRIGVRSVWVDSGYKAVEAVQEAISRESVFDIVLIDWRMPDMNGLETSRRLRKLLGAEAMIAIISAYDWNENDAEAKEAGVDYFIAKPLFCTNLYEAFLNWHQEHYGQKGLDKAVTETCQLCGRRVLLIEDNMLNMEIAQYLLEMNGLLVETAENGQMAVERFSQSTEGYFDALLMDIRMPVMDGIQATKTIRQLDRQDARTVPILAMTANAFDEDRSVAMQAGMTGFMSKPLNIGQLLKELEQVIIEK